MPNTAPPAHTRRPHAPARASKAAVASSTTAERPSDDDSARPAASTHGRTAAANPNAAVATTSDDAHADGVTGLARTAGLGSLPSTWTSEAGLGLLTKQSAVLGDRAPVNYALLSQAAGATATLSDLSAIWTLPEQPGTGKGRIVIRRMDDKGRIPLPINLTEDVKVNAAADRDGPVMTVFLPNSPDRPELSRVVAPLPLDARGRLTVNKATRREIAWDAGCDLLITFDAERRTLTIVATTVVENSVVDLVQSLRPSHARAGAASGGATGFEGPDPDHVSADNVLVLTPTHTRIEAASRTDKAN